MKKRKNENINNTNNINDAMSHIDDDLLDSALLMRRVLQQNQPIKNPARTVRKIAVLAACLVVATTATVIAVVAAPADQPATETTTAPVSTGEIIYLPLDPEWITMDEVYEAEPFSRYFPRSGFDNLSLVNCYWCPKELNEKNTLLMQPTEFPIEYGESMYMHFMNCPEYSDMYLAEYSLEITVAKRPVYADDCGYPYYFQNIPYTPYDPTDVESYERARHPLSYYYTDDIIHERKNKIFRSEDVSLEVIKNLYHDKTQFESDSDAGAYWIRGFRYSFEITILFEDDYTIYYKYYGDDITPEMMYEMITSAEYFKN